MSVTFFFNKWNKWVEEQRLWIYIYIYDRTWSKYSKAFSESKSESDLNFSCLQKLKAKKIISAWFICRNLFGDIGVSKTYQQEQVFNYEVFNK